MKRLYFAAILFVLSFSSNAQLFVARDTINVIENGYTLKMPWANGINFSNVSNIDLNLDGKKDIVAFDRINQFSIGRFRCFINTGQIVSGQPTYSANPELSNYFPFAANWAICLDYNCDGKEDIFCSTSGGISVYTNNSYTIAPGIVVINFTLFKSLLNTTYPGALTTNLYASSIGFPGITDIDNDGDLDILTFNPGGYMIEYHENVRTNCDSLQFQLNTLCWGKIVENNCGIEFNQTCSPKLFSINDTIPGNNRHSGSCLMCIDTDSDGDKDLLLGDIGCSNNNILYGHNNGSSTLAVINASTNVYPNYPSVGNTTQIKFNNFPCGYHVDVDGDNKKDLVACPSVPGSENFESMWYYKNTSATGTINFQFVKKNLFQDEMIEVGQNSFPVLFDYDADGLKDLLVGTNGYYISNSLVSKLALYKNIGTLAQPAFSLVTRDYAALSSYSLYAIMPTIGDVDGDGDTDIFFGTQSGQIYWLKNTAGPGVACSFSFIPMAVFVTPNAAAAPQLFDINSDGKLDLMIGGKNGKIMYYMNVGAITAPSFSLVNSYFGAINVQGNQNLYGIDGYATPHFFKDGVNVKLLVGSITGNIFYYSVPSASSACVLINATTNGINEGSQSSMFFEDINNDGKRDLFVGNGSGGLSYFSSIGPDVGLKKGNIAPENLVSLYPNPANLILNVLVDKIEVENGLITVTDILGKEFGSKKMNSNFDQIDLSEMPAGIYFVQIRISNSAQNFQITKKIIKE